MLGKNEGAIMNWQYRDKGDIGHKPQDEDKQKRNIEN